MKKQARRAVSDPKFLLGLAALAWAGNMLYALGEAGGLLKFWSPALVAPAMIAFVLMHGSQRYGRAGIWRFVLIVFAIGWSFESVSLLTGIPFGNYHYTEAMAPFLGEVPVFVLPAYGIMGYVSWSLACLIAGQRGAGLDRAGRVAVPLVAAGLMVAWDLSMDPLRATVENRWVWADGGVHMGVPGLNYLGWFVVSWLMFQSFALSLGQAASQPDRHCGAWWLAVPLFYLAFPVEYLLNPFLAGAAGDLVRVNYQPVPAATLFRNVALLSALTMVPAAVLGMACIRRPNLVRGLFPAFPARRAAPENPPAKRGKP